MYLFSLQVVLIELRFNATTVTYVAQPYPPLAHTHNSIGAFSSNKSSTHAFVRPECVRMGRVEEALLVAAPVLFYKALISR